MRALAWVALAGSVSVIGCGLDVGGLSANGESGQDGGRTIVDGSTGDDAAIGSPIVEDAGDDGGLDDASAKDAGGDGGTPQDGSVGACVASIPQGWSLVAYESARNPCPAGYGGAHDEVSGASAGAGACTCTCAIATQPDCTSGTIDSWYGSGNGTGATYCPNTGIQLTVASTCTQLPYTATLAQDYASSAVPFSGGTCAGTAQGNPGQVTKPGVRYCDVPSTDGEAVCQGMAPPSFASCITAAGDVACPAGLPFTNRVLVADDEMLVCSACTSCTVTGSCSNPKITFYADGQCTRPMTQPLSSDGSCVSTNANNQYVSAVEYSAQTNATCRATGSTSKLSPIGPHTLCCR